MHTCGLVVVLEIPHATRTKPAFEAKMFTGSGGSGGPSGSKNPYASSQASKSLSATFSAQATPQSTPWQNRSTATFGTQNTNFGGGFGGIPANTSSGFGGLTANQPSTGFGSTSTPAADNTAGGASWTSRSPGGFNLSSKPSAPGIQTSINAVTFKCRMCQATFITSEDLKKHIKTEGHFDTSRAPTNTFGGSSFAGQQAPRAFNSQPLAKGDSPAGGLFGLPMTGRDSVAVADTSGNLNATAPPFTPQPRGTPFGQTFGPSRAPRGAPLVAGGPPHSLTAPPQAYPPSHQQPPHKAWDKPKASQDARQQQAPRPFAPSQPPRQGITFGQTGFADSHGQSQGPGQDPTSQIQKKPPQPAAGNPYARTGATFLGNPGGPSGLPEAKSHPFVPPSAAPRPFSSSKFPATGLGGLPTVPEKPAESAKEVPTRPGMSSTTTANNNAYNNLSSADEGNDDGEDDDGEEEEEDDLNFSFSSQESATGDIHSTHSSPIKGPGLGSPAAAARARAEEVPQRALFSQSTPAPVPLTSHSSALTFGGTSTTPGNASHGSQGGATSSLMGFMKASSKFPPAFGAFTSVPSSQPQSAQQSAVPSQLARSHDDSAHGSDTESSNSDGTDVSVTLSYIL